MQRSMRRALLAFVVVVLAVALTVGVVAWVTGPGTEPPETSRPTATDAATGADGPADQASEAARTVAAGQKCDDVDRPFAPVRISVPGVARGVPVVTPPRDTNGVPGVPPLSADGKSIFAWDRAQGIRPGDPRGNVLLNAHTWPDGSALGNHLLEGLEVGSRIVLEGRRAELCYRVTEEVEVSAEEGLARYYDTDGPPQIAIVVCSGRRLGPGQWENRTVWFASPSA